MGVKFANNAYGTLNASISTSDASLTLTSGQGARFPSLGAGDFFYCTLIDTSNNLEVVKCTARSSDVLTITRAQESTTARAFTVGDRVELRVTAAGLEDNLDNTDIDVILPAQASYSGKFLTTDGTNSSWGTVPSAYGLQSMQTFSTTGQSGGTYTWTRPSGITKIKVYVVGAGGGGQSISSNQAASGGAGGLSIAVVDVSSISSVTVTLGSGGNGSSSSGTRGSSGGTSSFGSYVTATGGEGGISTHSPYDGGLGGIGTTTVTGAVESALNTRGNGGQRTGSVNMQGSGPGSFFGGGGVGAHDTGNTATQGQAGLYGGGAGMSQYTVAIPGGAGVVVVEEYA
jgi:hypothetical protein